MRFQKRGIGQRFGPGCPARNAAAVSL